MPKFYNEMLREDSVAAGVHLATLHVSAFCVVAFLKGRVDRLVNTGTLSVVSLRRMAIIGGYFLVAAGCGGLAFWSVRTTETATHVYTLTLNVVWVGLTLQSFGHVANYYEITRTNSGLLMGVGNTIGAFGASVLPLVRLLAESQPHNLPCCWVAATLPSSLSPLFVSAILDSAAGGDSNALQSAWAQVFVGVGGMSVLVAAIYSLAIVVDVVDEGAQTATAKDTQQAAKKYD